MIRIREMIDNGIDTATDIFNTSLRDKRLRLDIDSFEEDDSIELHIVDLNDVSSFELVITPYHGYYQDQKYTFRVIVPDFFPFEPYKVSLITKIFHPNVDEDGHVCLNILREDWMPSIDLQQVACSLHYLLCEPNPFDPLNEEAAKMMKDCPESFVNRIHHTYSVFKTNTTHINEIYEHSLHVHMKDNKTKT